VDRSHAVIAFPIRACTFYRFTEKFEFLDRDKREHLCWINETSCQIMHLHTYIYIYIYIHTQKRVSNSVLANQMHIILSDIDS